jgi:hypothetical protein
MSRPSDEEYPEAAEVCGEAYQVVGSLLSDLGIFNTERARKILDNLSQHRMVHRDILPWPSEKSEAAGSVLPTEPFTFVAMVEDMRAMRDGPRLPTPEEEAAMHDAGREAWADVPDAAEWQREVRGTDAHTIPEKVTTSPGRVQIPAESEHDAEALEIGRKAWADVPDAAEWQREIRGTEPAKRVCTVSTCRAEMCPGLRCGSPNCPLKDAK